MSLQIEKLEHNMAKLTIEVSAEEMEKATEAAFQKNKGKIRNRIIVQHRLSWMLQMQ